MPISQYTWDFGDGSPVATGIVINKYVIEAPTPTAGSVGTIFTARLTVQNHSTGETGSKEYYVVIQDKALQGGGERGHRRGALVPAQKPEPSSPGTSDGRWTSGYAGSSGYSGNTPLNVNAFEVNGHLESGDAGNPYTETVARGMRYIISQLTAFLNYTLQPDQSPRHLQSG